MSIGGISASSATLLQHVQNQAAGKASFATNATSTVSQTQTLDADHDGDTDMGGVDNNDSRAPGRYINVQA